MAATMGRPMGIVLQDRSGAWINASARLAAALARSNNAALPCPKNIPPALWARGLRIRERTAAMMALMGVDPATIEAVNRLERSEVVQRTVEERRLRWLQIRA